MLPIVLSAGLIGLIEYVKGSPIAVQECGSRDGGESEGRSDGKGGDREQFGRQVAAKTKEAVEEVRQAEKGNQEEAREVFWRLQTAIGVLEEALSGLPIEEGSLKNALIQLKAVQETIFVHDKGGELQEEENLNEDSEGEY